MNTLATFAKNHKKTLITAGAVALVATTAVAAVVLTRKAAAHSYGIDLDCAKEVIEDLGGINPQQLIADKFFSNIAKANNVTE